MYVLKVAVWMIVLLLFTFEAGAKAQDFGGPGLGNALLQAVSSDDNSSNSGGHANRPKSGRNHSSQLSSVHSTQATQARVNSTQPRPIRQRRAERESGDTIDLDYMPDTKLVSRNTKSAKAIRDCTGLFFIYMLVILVFGKIAMSMRAFSLQNSHLVLLSVGLAFAAMMLTRPSERESAGDKSDSSAQNSASSNAPAKHGVATLRSDGIGFRAKIARPIELERHHADSMLWTTVTHEDDNGNKLLLCYAKLPGSAAELDNVGHIQDRLSSLGPGVVLNCYYDLNQCAKFGASRVNGTVDFMTAVNLQSRYEGRDVHGTLGNKEDIFHERAYLANRTLFMLVAAGKKEFVTSADATKFLTSLRID